MTEEQKKQIVKMRKDGDGYKTIATAVGLSRNAVRTFCKKRHMAGFGEAFVLNDKEKADEYKRCLNCYGYIRQPKKGRHKKFCSDECRREWWKQHSEEINKKETAQYRLKCDYCGSEFVSYGNKSRKFCSHNCYIHQRFYESEENQN